MSKLITYKGCIKEYSWGEGDDILYLDDNRDSPLAERIRDDMWKNGAYLSVRYWISDKKDPKEGIQEEFIKKLIGKGFENVGHCYSECTGYLWTDEEIKVGGHDLIKELHSFVGQYLILEIIYHKEEEI